MRRFKLLGSGNAPGLPEDVFREVRTMVVSLSVLSRFGRTISHAFARERDMYAFSAARIRR